jgi:hypothetical protein
MIIYWCHYSPLKTAASRGSKQTAEEAAQVTGAGGEAATGNRAAQGDDGAASNKVFSSASTASR